MSLGVVMVNGQKGKPGNLELIFADGDSQILSTSYRGKQLILVGARYVASAVKRHGEDISGRKSERIVSGILKALNEGVERANEIIKGADYNARVSFVPDERFFAYPTGLLAPENNQDFSSNLFDLRTAGYTVGDYECLRKGTFDKSVRRGRIGNKAAVF